MTVEKSLSFWNLCGRRELRTEEMAPLVKACCVSRSGEVRISSIRVKASHRAAHLHGCVAWGGRGSPIPGPHWLANLAPQIKPSNTCGNNSRVADDEMPSLPGVSLRPLCFIESCVLQGADGIISHAEGQQPSVVKR